MRRVFRSALARCPCLRICRLQCPTETGSGLIGPNGAGKSTLLKVLAGDEDADAGEVATRKRARIGYVRQESTFADGLTVRDVLERAMVERVCRRGNAKASCGRRAGGWGLATMERRRRRRGGDAERRLAQAAWRLRRRW